MIERGEWRKMRGGARSGSALEKLRAGRVRSGRRKMRAMKERSARLRRGPSLRVGGGAGAMMGKASGLMGRLGAMAL